MFTITVLVFSMFGSSIYSAPVGMPHFKNVQFSNGSMIQCQRITDANRCLPGHEIDEECDYEFGPMKCVPCEEGLQQCDFLTSDNAIKCYKPQCPELGKETVVNVTWNEDGTCNWKCICNEAKGYSGTDPTDCTYHHTYCGINSELRDGSCVGCKKGYHNPDKQFGRCVPEPTKSPDIPPTSKDVTIQPSSLSSPIEFSRTTTGHPYSPNPTQSPTPQEPVNNNSSVSSTTIVILAVVISAVVIGIVIVIVIVWHKRGGPVNCCTRDVNNKSYYFVQYEEQGIAAENGKHLANGTVNPSVPLNPSDQGQSLLSGHGNDLHEGERDGEDQPDSPVDPAQPAQPANPASPDPASPDPANPADPALPADPANPEGPSQPTDKSPEEPAPAGCSESERKEISVALIFANEDENVAEEIKQKVNKMVLVNGWKVKIFDCNDPKFGGCKVNHPRNVISQCNLVLLVLTSNTSEDNYCSFMREELIGMTRLSDSQKKKTYSVRLLHTQPRCERQYSIPDGFSSVCSLDWFGVKCEDKLKELLNHLIQEA